MEPVKAVWMWPGDIVRNGAENVTERLHRAGFTDIFLLTKGQAGSVCYAGSDAALKTAYPDRDVLGDALRGAHKRHMRVHCWMTSSNDAVYKAAHPEEGLAHYLHGRNSSVITLTSAPYMDYMRRVIRELFSRYDADGLHLDYIRYGTINLGWGEKDMAALRARGINADKARAMLEKTAFGSDHATNAIFDAYTAGDADVLGVAAYRRDNVRAFARAMTEAARQVSPGVALSAALMPEGAYAGEERTKGVSGVAFAALHYGQSYLDAASLYDFSALMTYAKTYGKNGAWSRHMADNAMRLYGCRVLGGVQAYDAATGETLQDERTALLPLRAEKRYLGEILFRYGSFCFGFADRQAGMLRIENTLEEAVTRVTVTQNGETVEYAASIAPLGAQTFRLPLMQEERLVANAFAGDRQYAVLLNWKD